MKDKINSLKFVYETKIKMIDVDLEIEPSYLIKKIKEHNQHIYRKFISELTEILESN